MSSNNNNNNSMMEKRYIKKNGSLSPTSPTKKASFSEAVVNKTDVGEFQEGYFIMSTPDDQKMRRPNISNNYNKNSPQRRSRTPPQQQSTGMSDDVIQKPLKQFTPKQQKHYQQPQQQQQQSTASYSSPPGLSLPLDGLLLTPANITKITSYAQHQDPIQQQSTMTVDFNTTPKKNNNKPFIQQTSQQNFKQQQQQCSIKNTSYSTSPPRYDSPKKSSSSPQSTCWAGGAFNNSPSPSSLPIPNFEDFQSQPTVPDLQSMTFDLRKLLNITPTVSTACSD
ncbi:hypothetical protein PPL_09801 [Heterostelium album PN500]|uniref:Uncharacterized protein n=1 Tax=Heterostelium pallidum (strain ATCC 26659 / Pp 5 / PN500) TaxID=670386 RepID=D3BP38_HETP5|nr:hypothetical protein PPL_09801 [Heterostelium album PN500]EFA77048.1 hypothetical protein PPL_09801 [Heterostelium album PN500]|eukprot:XP_020429178.1 hypothetical protein PPL_09801 [Heterostelium album PN500]